MSGLILNSNNKIEFQGSTTLQDIINNFSVAGTGDISDLGLDTMLEGDLLENYGEGGEWFVRTEVAQFDQVVLGEHSKIEIDGDLQVNYNIITDINENKEIFTGVTSHTIKIGGNAGIQNGASVHSKVEIDGDLQVNYNILTDLDENKEIFTGVTNSDIVIGGNNSTVKVGKDLFVPNDVVIQGNLTQKGTTTFIHSTNIDISDNVILLNKGLSTENPNFSSGFLVLRNEVDDFIIINNGVLIGAGNTIDYTNHGLSMNQQIYIEGYNYQNDANGIQDIFVKKLDNNTFQIKYQDDTVVNDLSTMFNLNTDKRLYNGNKVKDNQFMGWDEVNSSFILGLTRFNGKDTTEIIELVEKSKLMIDNLETDSHIKLGGNITTTEQEDKELWKDIMTNKISIGGGNSTVEIGNDLKVYRNISTDQDENKEIFVGIETNTIKIGGDTLTDRSKTEIGGDLQVNYDILGGGDANQNKEIFVDMENNIKIGGSNSTVQIGNDLMVNRNISTDQDENKEIFVGIETNTIKIGGDTLTDRSKTEIGGDLQVNYDILGGGDVNQNKEIFVDMKKNIKIGGDESNVEIANTLEVKDDAKFYKHILADANEDKEIFTDVVSNTIKIGGKVDNQIRSKTQIRGDLQVDFNITTNTNSDKEIFTDVNGNISVGGSDSTFIIGNTMVLPSHITVNGNILTDDNEDKRIFENVVSNTIKIGGSNETKIPDETDIRSKTEIGGDLRVNYNIIGNNKQDISIFANEDYNITIGNDDSTVIIGNDLKMTNNIVASEEKNKEIFTNIEEKTIKIGGNNQTTRSKTEIGGDLQVDYDIVGGANSDISVFADNTFDITIGNNNSKVIIGNNLQLNNNILADGDEDKEIFTNVVNKTIKIGGDNVTVDANDNLIATRSKIVMGGDLQVDYNILTDNDEDKEFWKGVISKHITIGGGSCKVVLNSTDHLVLPIGNTNDRTDILGAIRYNSETSSFEGCDGITWGSLGGVIDVDRDTFITAENSGTADNDQLKFFTSGSERMRIDEHGNVGIQSDFSVVNLYLGGTDAIRIPSGSTNERPVAADPSHQGYIRWNSETNQFEGFGLNLQWGPLASGASKMSPTGETEIGLEILDDEHLGVFSDAKLRMKLYQTGLIAIGTPSKDSNGDTVPVYARVIVDISSNDAIRIPSGRTNDRPSTLNSDYEQEYKGYMRWNTDFNEFEGYIGNGIWGSLSKVISQDKKSYIEPFNDAFNAGLSFYAGSGLTIEEILKITTSGLQIFNSSGLERYTFTSDKLTTATELELDGKITMKGDIVAKEDIDSEIFTDIKTKTILIGGKLNDQSTSKTQIGGNLQVDYNILADGDENKEIFTNIEEKTIKIGGDNLTDRSKTEIGGDLQVNYNILADGDEDKEVFTNISNHTIKIGGDTLIDRSKTQIGGDLQVDYNILADGDENKEIFTNIEEKTIKIGGDNLTDRSKTEIGGDLQVNYNILADGDEDKEVFTNIKTKTIKIGGILDNQSTSTTQIGGDLQVDYNIIAGDDEEKYIFADVLTSNINIGGTQSSNVVMGYNLEVKNDIQVNRNIIADEDEDKEIFTGVLTKKITMGGEDSIVLMGNDIQVTKHITSKVDEDKEIFTNVIENRIKIGGPNSETFIGGNLKVNHSIISDTTENKEIFTNIAENDVTIGSDNGKVIIGNRLKVSEDIESQLAVNKKIFTNIGVHSVSIGSNFGQVITNNDLVINGANILANTDTAKNIFTNVKGLANSSITIGGVDLNHGIKSRTIINGDLQINHNIESGNVDEAKKIYTDVNTSSITIGGVAGKVIANNNLQVNNNIIAGDDDDKNIFIDVLTSDITIGGNGSRLIPGGVVVFKDDLICDVDKPKKIFENVVNNNITIGGTNCIVKINNDIEVGGNIISNVDEDKYLWNDIANNNIYIGRNGTGSIVAINNLQVNKKIISDIKEDKEIFTEINTVNTITIGGTNSTLVAGGNLKVTQGLFSGGDRDINIFNDITSKTISIGSVGAVTKFNSNSQVIMPIGPDVSKHDIIGSIRYNSTYNKMEVCHGPSLWEELGGFKSINKRTFISTESTTGANDNIFQIIVDNREKLQINGVDGNIFFKPEDKLNIDGDLEFTGHLKAGQNRNISIFSDISDHTITIGSGDSKVLFDSTDHIVIPIGDTSQRTNIKGGIRFNEDTEHFEGCDGNDWYSLKGITDLDGDTYIETETNTGMDNDHLKFITAGTEKMIIKSDGNIGVGIEPEELMHIGGNIRINGNITAGADVDKQIFNDISTKNITIGSGSSSVIFDSTSHIQIPTGLKLQRTNVTGALRFNSQNNVFEGYNGTDWVILEKGLGDLDGTIGITMNITQGELIFTTNSTTRLIINNDGNFGFGVASPQHKLDVNGTIKSTTILTTELESSTTSLQTKSHIMPFTDSNLNLGMPGKKFLSLYLDKQGVWLGDYTQITSDNSVLKFRTFTSNIPQYVVNAYRTQPGQSLETIPNIIHFAELTLGIDAATFTPYYWLEYLKTLGVLYQDVTLSDMLFGDDTVLAETLLAGGGFTSNVTETIISTDKVVNINNNFSAKHTTIDGNIQINGKILAGTNTEKIMFDDITSETIRLGSGSSRLLLNSNDSFIIPIGITNQRSAATGAMRFNSQTESFEGYDGTKWRTFGLGTMDEDRDTFIQAEQDGTDDDNMIFYTKGDKRMIINDTGKIGFGLDIDPQEEFDVNLISRFQKDLTINKNLTVHENIFAGNDNTDRTIFSDISSKKITLGSGSSHVIMNSTDHMIIPIGDTSQRTENTGGIRYNSETSTFEGCDGTNWSSLGGVSDVDKDTYISAETSATVDNDELKFVTAGTQRMIIDSQGDINIGSGVSKIVMNSNDHLVVPIGNTSERNDATGAIRYNSETLTFEGCDGTNWNSLVGVIDVDKDTYISAETSATVDNDELKFVTAGTQRMIINSTGIINFNNDTVFDGNLLADIDEDKEIFKDVSSKKITLGSGSSHVIMNSTDHMIIPIGDTSQRTENTGGIRYNSEILTFEGCDGTNWSSLGGVSDVDKDTYISAETSATVDNDELKFVTAGTQRMIIDSTGKIGIGDDFTPSTDFDVKGNAIIRGNLTVQGTRTIVNTTNLDISDNVIVLNKGLGSNVNTNVSSGILVQRDKVTTHTIAVTVVADKYHLDGVQAPSITLVKGDTYIFDQSDSSNDSYPLKFSTTKDGTHASGVEYTTGITPLIPPTSAYITPGSAAYDINEAIQTRLDANGETALITDANLIASIRTVSGNPNATLQTYVQDIASNHPNAENFPRGYFVIPTSNSATSNRYELFWNESTTTQATGASIGQTYDAAHMGWGVIQEHTPGTPLVTFVVPNNAPSPLYYYCGGQPNMGIDNENVVKTRYNNQFIGWDDSENAFILGETVNTGDEAPDNITLSSKSDLKIKDLYANDINIGGVIKSDDVKLLTNDLERMVIKNDGKIGMGESSPEKELDINLETRFKKKVTAENDIEFPNPSTNDPSFSILDLIGPPKSIVVNGTINTAVNFDVNIQPIVRYHVGFTPEKLPMITHLNIKLVKESDDSVLLDTSLSNTDINDFESLNKLRFSKQVGSNLFDNGKYSFFNLNTLTSTETYKLTMSFKNYHPITNEVIESNLTVIAPTPPDLINTFIVTIPSNLEGSTDVNTYYINDNPSFEINWTTPVANDGIINKYFVEYESIEKLNNAVSGNDTVEVELGNVNSLTKSLADGILYGTKYKFRIKAGNDADGIAEYGNYVESTYYTSVPSKPIMSNLSNVVIKPNSFTNIEAYNVTDYSVFDGTNFIDYNDSDRKLLKSTNNNFIDLLDINDINCSNVLIQEPSNTNKFNFKIEIINNTGNVEHSSQAEFDSFSAGSNRYTGETKNSTNANCEISVNIKDKYHNEIATNKAGHWIRANISGAKVKIPSQITFGEVRIVADVPSITTAADKYASFPFMIDDLVNTPSFGTGSLSTNQLHHLKANDAAADDEFGYSVAIDGNYAVVGAYANDGNGANSGSAYIFNVTTGAEVHKLTASDVADSDKFGRNVAISGNYAIVGAYYNDDHGSNSGSAYIFSFDDTTATELHKLTASDATGSDMFGYSVAISGNYAIVGASGNDDGGDSSGSAYIFSFDDTTSTELHKLTASDAAGSDYFGRIVGISGNYAIVGAYGDDNGFGGGSTSGSAYIFNVTTGTQLHKLTASDADVHDSFGMSVAIDGNYAIVGAYANDDHGSNSGSAYIFSFNDTTATELDKIIASDAADSDFFGFSLAISGNHVISGAQRNDDNGTNSGSAYIFSFSQAINRYVGVTENSNVTMVCGIASLNVDTTFDLEFSINDLTGDSFVFGSSDKKQIEITSNVLQNNGIIVYANDATFGISSNENSGKSITYNKFTYNDMKLQDISMLGDDVQFTITGYNLNGTIQHIKNLKLIRDKESINNNLKNKRYESWSGDLAWDNLPTNTNWQTTSYDNSVNLPQHELLLWNGIFTTESTQYKDYRAVYNYDINGTALTTDSVTNAHWLASDDQYRWALFKLTNTVQQAGTASFGIKFYTPNSHPFSVGITKQNTGFKCNILLPSLINDGNLYWYDVNKNFEAENTKITGNSVNGVTGLGVFDSKVRLATETTFKITPPVPENDHIVTDIWIRIGLERNGPVRISNIELVSI